MIATFLTRLPNLTSERGDTLMEVLISSMIVGLIVVGTLVGFDSVDHISAQERQHNEAATLANQSQEQLRTDPASVLETLGATGHSYTQAVGGITYTIKQTAELLPVSGSNATCNVTSSKRQSGNAFSIASTISWHSQETGHRKTLNTSSIITPPTGSVLEVDADNAPVATSGVSNVDAIVTFTPVESSSPVTLQQTTGSEGCVVFGGIPATSAVVEIAETPGYVTVSGSRNYQPKEVTIAPNYTTHYEVIYNAGGAITAEFAYRGLKAFEHKNDAKTKEISEAVTGDTFVALNTKMKTAPEFEDGSTRYGNATPPYEPLPAALTTPTPYEASATTEKNLFPFTASENGYWAVYAGDCSANNPESFTGGVKNPEKIVVSPGGTTTATIPSSYLELNVYKGTPATPIGLETASKYPVTITNTGCKSLTPDNEVKINEPKHLQETTSGAEYGGHLEHPFLPFGQGRLCLPYHSGSKYYTFTTEYKLEAAEQYPRNIFLGDTAVAKYHEKVKRIPSGTEEETEVVINSSNSTLTC